MWKRITKFFKHSETIFLARLNALMGFLAYGMSYVDPALLQPVLTPQNFALYVLVNGVVMEWARRRRATFPNDADDYPHENL